MGDVINYTGGGSEGYKRNRWPHPTNEKFNDIIRNTVNIYGIGSPKDENLLKKCKEYLHSRITGLIDHKIRRDTEEYYKVMNLKVVHGFRKDEAERYQLIDKCSFILCVGNWLHDSDAEQQYRMAIILGKPIFEMRYESSIPLSNIIRYLQPVRPIKDDKWDTTKMEDVLIYETPEGLLELMDGNHRHEFANRIGGVSYLSGWIIKQV